MNIPIAIEHFQGKIPRRPRTRKRRLNSEFAFFQSLSWLLLIIIFNNYMAHFLKNNNQMRITRTRLLCEMQANSFWAEFLRIIFKFRKRQKILPSLVYVLHKTWNWAFSRRSRAVTVKKCRKKRDARTELLFCLLNQLLFWRSRCRRRHGIFKSLVSCSALFKAQSSTSPYVNGESGFWNPGNFCLWNPQSLASESRIQLKNPESH